MQSKYLIWIKICVVAIALSLCSTLLPTKAFAQPWTVSPIQPSSTQLEALLEAKFLMGEADRFEQADQLEKAREKWLEAAEMYEQAEDSLGIADAFIKLGHSYQSPVVSCLIVAYVDEQMGDLVDCLSSENISESIGPILQLIWALQMGDEESANAMLRQYVQGLFRAMDYYQKGLNGAAEVYERLIQKDLKFDQAILKQAEDAYSVGYSAFEVRNYEQALKDMERARNLYGSIQFKSGEIRSLVIKARSQLLAGALLESLITILEAAWMANNLPLGTPLTERTIEGNERYKRGDFEGALAIYKEVLAIYEDQNRADKIASVQLNLGNVYAELGQWDEAEKLYQAALPVFVELENDYDEHNEAAARHNLGNIFVQTGHYTESIESYTKAIRLWKMNAEPEHRAVSYNGIALAYNNLGDYDIAMRWLETSQNLQAKLPRNIADEGDTLNNMGAVYFARGNYQEARKAFELSKAVYEELREPFRTQKTLRPILNIASIQATLGDFDAALETYQDFLDIAEKSGSDIIAAQVKMNIAVLHIEQGNYQSSIKIYSQILPVFSTNGMAREEAMAHNNLSMAYLRIGSLQQSVFHLNKALAIATNIDAGSIRDMEENNRIFLSVISELDRVKVRPKYIKRLEDLGAQDSEIAIAALGNLALFSFTEKPEKALSYAQDAYERSIKLGLDQTSHHVRILMVLIAAYVNNEKFDEGLAYAKQMVALANKIGDPSGEMIGYFFLSLFHLATQDLALAENHAKTAITQFEALQDGLTVTDLKSGFLGQLSDIYEIGMMVAWANGKNEQAFDYAERSRARALLDQLSNQKIDFRANANGNLIEREQKLRQEIVYLQQQIAQEEMLAILQQRDDALQSWQSALNAKQSGHRRLLTELQVANPEYASLISADTLSLAEIQEQIVDDHTTLVIFYAPSALLTTEALGAWIIDKKDVEFVRLPIPSAQLTNQIKFARKLITSRDTKTFLESAGSLYEKLIEPLKPYIRNDNLIIVPHEQLHYVPFAALWNAKDKRYLLEEYTISYAPSASALKYIQQKDSPNLGRMLALGDPDNSLEHAGIEVQAIAEFHDTSPLLFKQATESRLRRRVEKTDLLHIAAHGKYNHINPMFSYLELAPDYRHDGRLEVHEIYGLDLSDVNLVVLSACDTSQGELSGGDEIIGLHRAFLYAGTPAVISTLWPIADEASAALMTAFYGYLDQKLSTAEALQAAQQDVLSVEQWRSPYYWAAFTLNGLSSVDID